MKSSKFLLVFLLFFSFKLQAQEYLFPVKPGERASLSGNFSEIRPNHFHSGIDVKIGGVDGEPILAISDGYVHRIKLSTYGYGNVIYLKHTNGQSSVYAHLRNFSPKISRFMREEMYKAEKNELELFLSPETLPIKKGEILGNGGNTGSSGGPHLHFEIRDSLERALDPFSFGFAEVVDNTPPQLYRVAIRPIGLDSRVNGKFQRQEFNPVLEGGRYVLREPIKITGKIGVEVYAIDRMDGVNNIFGVPTYELWEGGKNRFKVHVDHVDFAHTRFLLQHTHQNRFIKLYLEPNNPMQLYRPDSLGAGLIGLLPGEHSEVTVQMIDFFGNGRALSFQMEGEEPKHFFSPANVNSSGRTQVSYHREIMKIEAAPSYFGNLARVYVNSREMELPPAYMEQGKRIYLWDMNFGIPDSVDLCTEILKTSVVKKIPFGKEIFFANRDIAIHFAENSMLDDLFLRIEKTNNTKIRINSPQEYLQANMEVLWKNPGKTELSTFTHVYFQAGNGRKSFVGGEWEGEDIRFKTRNFGTFVLEEDRTAPSIRPVRINREEIRFLIRDDKSGIRDFEAYVDGKWLLMRYEHKQNLIWSEKLDKQPLKGEVLLKVRDMAGNEARYTAVIN
ncbi:M23 family metallopeptidase [Cecembia lonarensis]|uniref:Peptidase family M23 n=1 Tax=Cecembia lonarensis (strain CCUG 58316 / KCTC 22772 / LW9) TaxID=1225176 RepID=K1L1S7_CECL9|nr:M23 family metallopeptidase [Cecembia lonarensis]EKB50335.1 Peptidase family M23 [Cecembia lonarensis LW9]